MSSSRRWPEGLSPAALAALRAIVQPLQAVGAVLASVAIGLAQNMAALKNIQIRRSKETCLRDSTGDMQLMPPVKIEPGFRAAAPEPLTATAFPPAAIPAFFVAPEPVSGAVLPGFLHHQVIHILDEPSRSTPLACSATGTTTTGAFRPWTRSASRPQPPPFSGIMMSSPALPIKEGVA